MIEVTKAAAAWRLYSRRAVPKGSLQDGGISL